jgi:hypothetical protein
MTKPDAVDLGEVLYVLRLARDGKLAEASDWTTDGFASAVWNGLITKDDAMTLTPAGESFLAKVGALYRERKASQ